MVVQFGIGCLPFARHDELRAEGEQGELAVEQEQAGDVAAGNKKPSDGAGRLGARLLVRGIPRKESFARWALERCALQKVNLFVLFHAMWTSI